MAEGRGRWIDDVSDEYDSSAEETETQPCSVSPMRRQSFSAVEVPTDLAADCLTKQLELTQPPYHFLLIGIPYKTNNAKKLGKLLLAEGWEQRLRVKMFYNGNAFTGKSMISVESREDAREIIKLHGKVVGNRAVSVEVFREMDRRSNPKPSTGAEAAHEEDKSEGIAQGPGAGRGRALPTTRGRAPRFRARK